MILGAIDIGSNAVRLLISEAAQYEGGGTDYTKLSLLRIPLRLGEDVFNKGLISKEKADRLTDTMKVYSLLMKIYNVEAFKACATSAMRDAANGEEIKKRIAKETGISLNIITGAEEAGILYETQIAENISPGGKYLYIDVGGGSTELTLYEEGITAFNASFNIGTVRMLGNSVADKQWEELKAFLKNKLKCAQPVTAIGSGGNINKIFSLSGKKEGKPLSLELLKDYYKELSSSSLAERMHLYNLRKDRADVIVPALQIYTTVMKWAGATEIYVPKVGLVDGLIKKLYRERTTLM